MSNLYSALMRKGLAPARRRSIAIQTEAGLAYSFQDLDHASGRIANWLESLGLDNGALVAVQVEKSPEAVMLYLACLRAGLVFVPLNTAYRAGEMAYFLEDARPALVVCDPAARAWVEPLARAAGCPLVESLGTQRDGTLLEKAVRFSDRHAVQAVSPDQLAAILYTSGTTGRSKGAMLTHKNLKSNAEVLHAAWHWTDGDVLLHALPIFHVHGLFVALHGALLNASRMLWHEKFDPEAVLEHLAEATILMGVPTFYTRLLALDSLSAERVKGMRLFVSGSAPLLPETHEAFTRRTGHQILERYGMSETVMLTSNPYEGPRKPGTVGKPLEGVGVRLVNEQGLVEPAVGQASDIGGVQVRGPNVFVGYWNRPEKTREEFTEDGWFKTGDLGRWDADGFLVLVGRSKDLIITGGYNVYPKEVEALLDEQPEVEESAVVGIPHPDFGEAVVAEVVLKRGADIQPVALIARLKTLLAGFKVPKQISIVPSLPRNVMGKVQKNLIRDRLSTRLPS
jgi:malonyl-CoA/methylmalonyl-CoA synthetase